MDGVLLAGGLASRLGPITKVTNKHLLPIYDKPMIFYGIETLKELGCERVIIILGGNSVGDIVNLVRDGSQFGVQIIYKFQHEPRGISHAIQLATDLIQNEYLWPNRFLVLLGDNIFANKSDLKKSVDEWYMSDKNSAAIFLHSSDHPHDYGQPILKDEGMAVSKFVEKDSTVDHNLIVTGLYGLTETAFFHISQQTPSVRGELEITDTLTELLPDVEVFHYNGFWSDCGTPEGLVEASNYMKRKGEKDGNND
jgi:glucose-1-phosphate thymidylyltransferase